MRQERIKIALTCLSPVHVGNGVTLHPFEYLYDKNKQEVYFLNQRKWTSLLIKHHLLADISHEAAYGLQISLWEWLCRKNVSEEEILSLGQRKAAAKALISQNGRKKNTLNDIACQISLADGTPYLPGSSIKGALRTGILYTLLQKDERLRQQFWQECSHNIRSLRDKRNKTAESMETRLLHKIPTQGKEKITNAIFSALRGLSVSDAYCCEPTDTVIVQKYDATPQHQAHGISLYRECLPSGTKLTFTITMDKAFLQLIGVSSIEEILAGSREYVQQGISVLQKAFGKDYPQALQEAKQADMLLGGGTGFLSKTLWLSLAPTEDMARTAIAEVLDLSFYKHHHHQRDRVISPRTLKLAQSQQGTQLMGLCQLQEVQ